MRRRSCSTGSHFIRTSPRLPPDGSPGYVSALVHSYKTFSFDQKSTFSSTTVSSDFR